MVFKMVYEKAKVGSDVKELFGELENPEVWGRIALAALGELDLKAESLAELKDLLNEKPQVVYNNTFLWRSLTLMLSLRLSALRKEKDEALTRAAGPLTEIEEDLLEIHDLVEEKVRKIEAAKKKNPETGTG